MRSSVSGFVSESLLNYTVSAKDIPERCGDKSYVYSLVSGGEIVYIGSSASPRTRFLDHKSNKDFDGMYFIDVGAHMSLDVECYLISTIQPSLNKTSANGCESFLSSTKMAAIISSFVINEMTTKCEAVSESIRGMYHVDSIRSILAESLDEIGKLFIGNSISCMDMAILSGMEKKK